jgi:NAD(P)H-nitrite reductase large subunit
MACVCRVARGGVTIDTKLDPRTLPEPEPELPTVDLAEETGIKRVVIIGNGAAGISAANEIRRLSPSCAIDVVAREKEQFYNRMAIARLLYGRTAMAGLFLQDPDWAKKKKVTVWLNTAAMRIDRDAHELILGTGEKLPYDKLVLAQGSRALMPPIPGSDLPGCFVLREAGGAMEIRAWRQQHQCRSAVVVGGGVLGIEAADALRRLNLTVTILQRTDRLMERQLDAKGSAILERYLAGLGIRVVTDVSGLTCRGDSRLETVQLADGEVMEAEIMVACAGIGPNAEIARDAGLEVERGVKVDRSMRSSDPDIFAVGDVAELPGSISGLWAVSTAQGRVAAAALFGRESSYSEPSTLVNLKMDGIDVKSYGLISASSAEQETITGVGDGEDEHRLLIVEGGRLLGAIFVGPPGTGRHVADLVEQKPDLTPILDDLRRGDWDALSRVVGAPRVAQAAE